MTSRCWFADRDAGDCGGRLDPAHLIPRQVIRREVSREFSIVWSERVIVPICRAHHHRLDVSRTVRIPRNDLPESVETFAADHGLVWWLDRNYGARDDG